MVSALLSTVRAAAMDTLSGAGAPKQPWCQITVTKPGRRSPPPARKLMTGHGRS